MATLSETISNIRVKNAEALASYKKHKESLALDLPDISDEDENNTVRGRVKYLLEAKVISEVYSEFVSNLDAFGFDGAVDQLSQHLVYFGIAASVPNIDVFQNGIHQLTLRTLAEITHFIQTTDHQTIDD